MDHWETIARTTKFPEAVEIWLLPHNVAATMGFAQWSQEYLLLLIVPNGNVSGFNLMDGTTPILVGVPYDEALRFGLSVAEDMAAHRNGGGKGI